MNANGQNMVVPGNMKPRHVVVEAVWIKLAEDASSMAINKVEYNDTSIGFITCGIGLSIHKRGNAPGIRIKNWAW